MLEEEAFSRLSIKDILITVSDSGLLDGWLQYQDQRLLGLFGPSLHKPLKHAASESGRGGGRQLYRLIGSQWSANWKYLGRDLEALEGKAFPLVGAAVADAPPSAGDPRNAPF